MGRVGSGFLSRVKTSYVVNKGWRERRVSFHFIIFDESFDCAILEVSQVIVGRVPSEILTVDGYGNETCFVEL